MKLRALLVILVTIFIMSTAFAKDNTQKGYTQKASIIVNNLTPYAITLHIDDYNQTPLFLNQTTVNPNSKYVNVGYYLIVNNYFNIQFDTQLGPGSRNCINTTVYTVNDGGYNVQPFYVYVNNQQFVVYPELWPWGFEITIEPITTARS